MDTSASDVQVTPLKANQWGASADNSANASLNLVLGDLQEGGGDGGYYQYQGDVAPRGYSASSPNSVARGGRLPTPPSSTKKAPRATDEEEGIHPQGDLQEDIGEIQGRVKQLQLEGDIALGRTDAYVANAAGGSDRRGVVPLGGGSQSARSTKSGSAPDLASARAMARRVSAGNATTDAARMIALEEECRSLSLQVHSQEKGLVQLNAENEKNKKTILQLQSKAEKDRMALSELSAKAKVTESQLALAKKELAVFQRQASKGAKGDTTAAASAKEAKDLRLQRALEEVDRLRAQLKEKENTPTNAGQGQGQASAAERSHIQHLTTENKKLEAQRSELLVCIRKQNKLIDVLKRQKIHLEASRLLQITEEEFTKAMEANLEA